MDGFHIIKLLSTASTQDYLLDMDRDGRAEEWSVVYTTHQTNGRGQGTHIWESEKDKNISFSFCLKPHFLAPINQYLITKTLSLAVCDAIDRYLMKDNDGDALEKLNNNTLTKIKWPNDIYIGQEKICGILSQAKIIGQCFDSAFIGIGVNVNQKNFLFAPNPTSLFLKTNREYDLDTVLNDVLEAIDNRYGQLKNGNIKSINKDYLDKLLFKGVWRKYIYEDKEITARIIDVNNFGHIVFETLDHNHHTAEMKHFSFVLDKVLLY